MTEIAWREVKRLDLKMTPGSLWRLAHEYVQGPRLLRLRVLNADNRPAIDPATGNPVADASGNSPQWGKDDNACTPDGAPTNPPKDTVLLCSKAPRGALVAKLGGSSADHPDTAANSQPYGSRKVFAVGSYCVILVAKDDSGPLFLTRNETLDAFREDMGELKILIEEAVA